MTFAILSNLDYQNCYLVRSVEIRAKLTHEAYRDNQTYLSEVLEVFCKATGEVYLVSVQDVFSDELEARTEAYIRCFKGGLV